MSILWCLQLPTWLFDPFSLQAVEVDGRTLVRPLNDNLTFLLNIAGYAVGDDALIAIRSRGTLERPFTRVAELFRDAEQRIREEERTLAGRVAEIEGRIATLPEAAEIAWAEQLPPEIAAELGSFRTDLLAARRALRELRRRIRAEVDSLGRWLTALNLAAGPLLCGGFALGAAAWRRRAGHRGVD